MRSWFFRWTMLVGAVLSLSSACGVTQPGDECAVGSEGCHCYGNDTCDAPLVCLSSLCVLDDRRPAGAAGGEDGAAESEAGGGSSGSGGSRPIPMLPSGGSTFGHAGTSSAGGLVEVAGTGNGAAASNEGGDNGFAGVGGDAGAAGDGGAPGNGSTECDGPVSLPFEEIGDLPAPGNAVRLIYAPRYGSLVLANSASAAYVVDIASGESKSHPANTNFTDLSLSPDGRYVFVADYGGENIGYGTPLRQSYVHRLDLADGSWEVKKVYIAGRVEATSSDHFVLMSLDQWVTFTYNAWSQGLAATQIFSQWSGVYSGDIEYDSGAGRLLHGNTGISSPEVNTFKLLDDKLVGQEGTGTYGSANGFGGTMVLATDASAFYYGRLSVDARDVSRTLGVFPEAIFAATGDHAFGFGTVYDAHTRELVDDLGVATNVYGLNDHGSDFWVFDGADRLRHFAPDDWCGARD